MTGHDDLEARLTDVLGERASTMHASADTADLFGRVRKRSRRRQQVLGTALALALVAGPIVGFQIGNSIGDDDGAAVASESGGGDRDDAPASTQELAPVTDSLMGGGGGFTSGRDMAGDSGYGFGYGQPLERVGVVEVGDTTIRLFRSNFDQPDYGNPTWEAPVGCFPTGSVMAEASTAEMVAIAGSEVYGLAPTEGVVTVAGVAEGDPHWIAIGTTPATAVTVRFSDGQSVTAAVVDGVFAAAAPADGVSFDDQGNVEAAVNADGVESTIRGWSGPTDENFYQQCEPPPPALPPAGEQPADPDAARAEISEMYRLAYNGGGEQLDAFADPEPMRSVLEELDASETFDQYRGKVTAVVGEIVFDTPTHAFLFYDLESVLTGRIGEAVLTDRGWRVANETMCSDVSMVGVQC